MYIYEYRTANLTIMYIHKILTKKRKKKRKNLKVCSRKISREGERTGRGRKKGKGGIPGKCCGLNLSELYSMLF